MSTADGYVLTLHRIINPLVSRRTLEKRPVLLQHGFGANSAHWVINSEGGQVRPVDRDAPIDANRVDDSLGE